MTVESAFGPAVALAAGAISFLSPCVLPLVPIYAAQMAGATAAGTVATRRDTFIRSLMFVLGFSTVFIVMGASAGFVGSLLVDHERTLAQIAGVTLIVFGLHQSGIMRIPLLYRALGGGGRGGNPRGYAGWAVVGGGLAIAWLPCIGPTLGTILSMLVAGASKVTALKGAVLLTFYSAGLAIPFMITGLLAGRMGAALKRMNRAIPVVELVSGVVMIIAGVLIFTNQLTLLNPYFERFDIFGIGSSGGL